MRRALLCSLALIVAAGCSGGGDGGAQATSEVSEADLALMALAKDSLAEEYRGFDVDTDSGPTDNAAAAEDTINPEDTAADLHEAGRVAGYDLVYSPSDLTSAFETGEGPVEVRTSVELFRDEEAASAYIDDQLADFERFIGHEVSGATFVDFEEFDVSDIGEEVRGVRTEAKVGDVTLHGTFVAFRSGRLVPSVGITRVDDRDVTAQAKQLASALESRVEGVTSGEITGEPVPIPAGEDEAAPQAEPPAGAPDLSGLALQPEDLPEGFTVASEGYETDTQALATFAREFDTSEGEIDGTKLVGLTNGVDLFETESAAELSLGLIAQAYTSRSGQREFARAFAESAGFEAKKITVRELEAGPDTAVISALIQTPIGTFEGVFLYSRVGAAVGNLIAIGNADDFEPEDVLGLLEPMRKRLATEPG